MQRASVSYGFRQPKTIAFAIATGLILSVSAVIGTHLPKDAEQAPVPQIEAVHVTNNVPYAPSLEGAARGASLRTLRIDAPPVPHDTSRNSLVAPQIARVGTASLFVGNVGRAIGALSQLARSEEGDVFSLQDNEGDSAGPATASMDIRIPADRFDATMNALAHVGKVRQRSVTAEDLSGDITDSSARLRNLQQTEADIRTIMDRSGSVSQIMSAENQLSDVRGQIETLESDLKSMRTRVVYSTISVNLEAEAAAATVEPTALSQLVTAWRSAVHALSQTSIGLVAALLWVFVFVPYAIALVILWVGVRSFLRRLGPRQA